MKGHIYTSKTWRAGVTEKVKQKRYQGGKGNEEEEGLDEERNGRVGAEERWVKELVTQWKLVIQ